MNREPRELREKKNLQKEFAQPKKLCSFAYFAYFAVSTAESIPN